MIPQTLSMSSYIYNSNTLYSLMTPCNLVLSALACLAIYKVREKPVPKFLNLVGFLCPIYLYILQGVLLHI